MTNRYSQIMKQFGAHPLGEKSWGASPPLTEEEIQEIEEKLDCRLPEDYREFIRDFGMYTFSERVVCPLRPNEESETVAPVRMFYGFDRTRSQAQVFDLLDAYRTRSYPPEADPEIWPPLAEDGSSGILPIVYNRGGTFIGLQVKGEGVGKIYYFFRDLDAVLCLADSFDEFMHLLVREEE